MLDLRGSLCELALMKEIADLIADVPDFPKPGIVFKDITTLLEDPKGLALVVDAFKQRYQDQGITHFAGIKSRGFIFASALAHAMGLGMVLIRKPGKLPRATHSASYALEYGEDTVQIHQDAVGEGDKVVIVDDLIATGGTARAAADLVLRCGAEVHEIAAVIELTFLPGREKLGDIPAHALVAY